MGKDQIKVQKEGSKTVHHVAVAQPNNTGDYKKDNQYAKGDRIHNNIQRQKENREKNEAAKEANKGKKNEATNETKEANKGKKN